MNAAWEFVLAIFEEVIAVGVEGEPSWAPVIPEEDLQKFIPIWLDSDAVGRPHEAECRYRRATDGEYHWHLSRALPIRDVAGAITRWFGTNTDIHDQKLVEAALAADNAVLALIADTGR